MAKTHFCIICGGSFESDDPEAVFCPAHGGKAPAKSGQETQLEDDPQRTVHQPGDPHATQFTGKGTLDADSDVKPQDFKLPGQDLADWPVGQVILDTYEVKGTLGKGGFGKVYRAYHKGWNMDLAIKRALNLDEENKQDFIDEAQHWIDLGLHPHIISCYYVRNIDGFPHTFAELAEGGSLKSWIQGAEYDLYEGDRGQVLGRILDIAIQFAWGLGYAHQQGLVHQDVKPDNALMTPEGVLKVTDFGLAKAKGIAQGDSEQRSGTDILVSGGGYTLAYRSPEQAQRKKLSQKTDMWSWGVSVLEMFNGEISWKAGDLAGYALESYLGRAGEEDNIPPMPDAVADMLRQCFQDDPLSRPRDMLEIAERLVAVYQQEKSQPYLREIPKPADLRAESLNNKALSMLDLGKPVQAEAFLEQAVAADSQHVEATYNLGLLHWRSARMADVDLLQKLQQIQQDKPEEGGLASALGWVCLESGRFGEALAYFEQANRLGGDRISAECVRLARPLAERGAGACLRTFEGHTDLVKSVAISPDGRKALSGSEDKTLKLWNLEKGKCLCTFEGHTAGVNSVVISPDGCQALSGGNDKTLKLWNLEKGKCLRTFEGHTAEVNSVVISPDGCQALSGGNDKTLKLWDLEKGACLRTFEGHTAGVNSVVISPDGCHALSGADYRDKTLKLWDLHNGACLSTFEGHLHSVDSVAFNPDGRRALSGSHYTLKLWDLATGNCLRTYKGHTGWVQSVAISPDGRWALSGSKDQTLKLWDLATGKCLRTFEGHKVGYSVVSVAFSPDGCWALSGSWDQTLKLWDLAWVEEHPVTAPLRYARGVEGSEAERRERAHTAYLEQTRQLMEKGEISKALEHLEQVRGVPGFERASTTLALSANLGARAKVSKDLERAG
jgi:WD40 repeat protein/serine/threonine protein kinase